MMTLKQRLDELLREKKARAAAREADLINQAPIVKKENVPKKDPAGSWSEFRDLSNEKVEKKLERLPEDEMLQLYKKLERECGYRIDPENYKRHKIIKNFILLWTRKKEDDERKKSKGEELVPLTRDEVDQVMSNRGRGLAGKVTRILDDEPF